jgi:biotin synthase
VIPLISDLYDGRVEILLNLGNKTRAEYAMWKEYGAYSYITKHETSDRALYYLMKEETLEERLRCIEDLLALGYKVGTGSIIGLPGQSVESIADDILLARDLGAHMVSASPFVPAPNTPLDNYPGGSVQLTLRVIAVTRLLLPDVLIPSVSALELYQEDGQANGLAAGANVLTVNFTPPDQRTSYHIYGKNRYVVKLDHLHRVAETAGLSPGGSIWVTLPGDAVAAQIGSTCQ